MSEKIGERIEAIKHSMTTFAYSFNRVFGIFRIRPTEYRVPEELGLIDGEMEFHLSMNDPARDLAEDPQGVITLTKIIDGVAQSRGGRPMFDDWIYVSKRLTNQAPYYFQRYSFPVK